MMGIAVVIALLVALGVAESPGVRAQSGAGAATTAAVEVTVWRSISDPSQLYISTRPAGGRWRTLNTPSTCPGAATRAGSTRATPSA